MKKYLIAIILITGTLAIISFASAVPNQLQPVTTSTSLHSQESSFFTTTASVGDANVTEFLVDTDVQFPIGGANSEWQTSNFLILAALLAFSLFIAAIVVGIKSTRGAL